MDVKIAFIDLKKNFQSTIQEKENIYKRTDDIEYI